MIKYISPFAIVALLSIGCIEVMDREWLADYQKQTGQSARFAESDDECRSNEHFDARFGICVKIREFTTDDQL
nr:MAG TPA: hypothetical protein [Caudoviricetes sp.]